MIEPNNAVLVRMLDRLFASMVNGPAINARPHNSRQRVDLAQLSKFDDLPPADLLRQLLRPDGQAKVEARVPIPPRMATGRFNKNKEADEQAEAELTAEERAARQAYREQQSLVTKLRVIADEARTYEQDTGVHALEIGYPMLHLPAGSFNGPAGPSTRTILAPVAFIPVTLTVKAGARQVIEIACRGDGMDRVVPNVGLLAWIEQQTGKALADVFADETGEAPWRELRELAQAVAEAVDAECPDVFRSEAMPDPLPVEAVPRSDSSENRKRLLPSAIVGLFPTTNQGLLRDTRDMIANGVADGPIENFIRHDVEFAVPDDGNTPPAPAGTIQRQFAAERFVAASDPCQSRAVRLSHTARGLVVHGPPGTGKSQTITNIIGDHLSRGERVLFVCDKRTALDVVADRLDGLGLSHLCAVVHDPQRDQRSLYMSVRDQLDKLTEAPLKNDPARRLAKIDDELQTLHDELSAYHRDLMTPWGGPGSFHDLVGQWLGETGSVPADLDESALQQLNLGAYESALTLFREVVERGQSAGYATNRWRAAIDIDLATFLATPMERYRRALADWRDSAAAADQTRRPHSPAIGAQDDLSAFADRAVAVAGELPLLAQLPADSRTYWRTQETGWINDARQRLEKAQPIADRIAAAPLDADLLRHHPSANAASHGRNDLRTLTDYADAFERIAGQYQRARSVAGRMPADQLKRWLAADSRTVQMTARRLETAKPTADAIEQAIIDPSLLARFDASPVDLPRIGEWIGVLNTYLRSAGRWYAFFFPGRRKAADPVAQHFGLTLSPGNAVVLRDFLVGLQQRIELKNLLNASGAGSFETTPDDATLLSAFHNALNATTTLAAAPPADAAAPSSAIGEEDTAFINELIGSDHNAAPILARYALPLSAGSARKLAQFLEGCDDRQQLIDLLAGQKVLTSPGEAIPDSDLLEHFRRQSRWLALLVDNAQFPGILAAVDTALADPDQQADVIAAMNDMPARTRAIAQFESHSQSVPLFKGDWAQQAGVQVRSGASAIELADAIVNSADTIEAVLRVREGRTKLPEPLANAATELLKHPGEAADGLSAVRRIVLAGEIARCLRDNPRLQAVDGQKLQSSFDRFRELSDKKKSLVLESIRYQWLAKQKERFLSEAGTRRNRLAADLAMRLKTRGTKAMRLRQVLAHGQNAFGGDPLFDLRPVWMASPETVAQIFPSQAIFDVIIFDEASQCRLEEALPVLVRGQRVVIAGDPKQLPPTRFFESAVAICDEIEAETDQELFEAQQSDVEDLLTAALSIEIEQSYLDVHYRSRNSDLIGFSNRYFYASRLQAIPGHPSKRPPAAPIVLHRADGIYEKRQNLKEAEQVVAIVEELLKQPKPPSIGIACFNLVQRDLIIEKLDERAEEDADFATRLSAARERRGKDSFEGLFVKNLENVQGDERDHIIVSTTYGPDASGKFRRNFGPIGNPGGGRRLNVLVTRAKQALHVVTSIPRSAYASLPQIPAGAQPAGGWLLFAYLAYADELRNRYDELNRLHESADPVPPAIVNQPTRAPSRTVDALAERILNEHGIGSITNWGNDGFTVDVAIRHPVHADDVTAGVLCDTTRYTSSDDPVEWDIFRTGIHEGQGWKLHRVWTPHLFRDAEGIVANAAGKKA